VKESADVLVVGAGPAGATAARVLALGGARVLVLDKARFPRNKPCGGGVTTRALGRFPHLRASIHTLSPRLLSRLHLEGPSGHAVTLASETPAVLTVRRVDLDHLLVRLAIEAGAEVAEGIAVSGASLEPSRATLVARDGRVFRAPLVVAADGVNSVVARRLGLNPGWPSSALALDMMEETPTALLRPADSDMLWVSYGFGSTDGYAYVFPKHDHVNVGVGCLLSCYKGKVSDAPYDLQRRLVETLRRRGVLVGSSSCTHFTPFLIPVGGPLPCTALGRVLLAGDAGGFVNAYTAEGIYYAMVSGELAGRAILSAAAGLAGDLATRYESAWRREIGGELRDSRLIQKYLFQHGARIDGVVRSARLRPAITRMIIAYATGAVSYRAARRRVLLRFPQVLARLGAIAARG
jgi:geranylgeranyl reductase family protein